jgi:hypothetical protein
VSELGLGPILSYAASRADCGASDLPVYSKVLLQRNLNDN